MRRDKWLLDSNQQTICQSDKPENTSLLLTSPKITLTSIVLRVKQSMEMNIMDCYKKIKIQRQIKTMI